ncbi:MAG: hypothetical protein A2W61_04545 [Deltaproteobacteria bacterium RIFCSPLOWO2_01_44_7]|nr:MAG: hypothetical protein A2712_05660 [Deltaproteobacteria bacterium RIFCSPHIGHO2_01_FULL_43_49]OGQ14312.1 MAG: hypothetical protein A3D22_04725 [Deltaproteobacteria bacterium RIFCSPHIGHO2_02_FULL_44_53]OGQ27648.1 MAG: hypothetical protein A3D98_09450 [Deltaproteobacteria bacterium RIFCSPHIGHO2_12_FULL_44_21]OGQ30753.1 MAG: hypothetical protein A2979_01135 [Deltaproteobacteria bacterium RIFCSPLOWO2_01_FULL_45_74]OGQ41138.1 MAG: hypothetical protein A2W61_04545 [Deltaproteobacteria bacterium 
MEFSVEQFLKASGAKVISEGTKALCKGISTDSRSLKVKELFFALKGPHFDGHRFCDEVIKKGAWGVVVQNQKSKIKNQNLSWIFEVKDTLKALGDIAQWWRSQFSIPCVAITGSNGKTTTKEMIASITQAKWKTLKTDGNFNNLIGLPLTLNRLNKDHGIAVLEMGMNAVGEIERLTKIASPTVGIVTNAAAAHLEKLHTVEAVAKAKAELYEAMNPEGYAIYNAEDPWLSKLVKNFKGKKISFGMRGGCDILFEHMENFGFDSMELKLSVQGKLFQAKLKATGLHNVMNAMSACAVGVSLNLSHDLIQQGLENFTPLKMRLEQIQLDNGVRLVNDAYNANPVSMEAAFRTVGAARRAGRFIAVLGDMKELGEKSEELHQEVGHKAIQYGISKLFVIGDFAKHLADGAKKAGLATSSIYTADNEEQLVKKLESEIESGDIVLVKGSRAMHLENVVEALKERFGI